MIIEIPSPTILAEGTRAVGSITFQSSTQVFGSVDGDLIQESLEPLQIGKSGWINGGVASRGPISIEGRVEGDISSETKIKLLPTAVVTGQLSAPCIEIVAGAQFDGSLRMSKTSKKDTPVPQAA